MMHTRKEQMEAFGRFLDVLDELREKCPWDRKQTNESLRPNTIEETSNGYLSAFPSGEGGPLAVDEEVTFLKSQTLPKKSSKALLSAGL